MYLSTSAASVLSQSYSVRAGLNALLNAPNDSFVSRGLVPRGPVPAADDS